jgi:hypothetical protein
MYNEIVKGALDSILQTHPESIENKDERIVNEIVSQALTDGGYPNIQCLSIFLNWSKGVEGVIHNGVSGINEFKFRYDFENGEFTTID